MDNPDRPLVRHEHRRRYLDRITAFSDGGVAIALTLLVLPLVDIIPPDVDHGQTAWDVLRDEGPLLSSFAITFVVIAVMWMAHSRVFMVIEEYDAFIVWANVFYLFAIVTLPFPSKWLQVAGFDGGIGTLYFLALATSSISLYAIGVHAHRHPELLTEEGRSGEGSQNVHRGAFYGTYFVIGVVVSIVLPSWAGWYLVALWPAAVVWDRFGAPRLPRVGPAG
jgi:uncharacterized membrane protein